MKLLKRIHNRSILELQDLQEEVLTEIQRRKVIVWGGPDASADEPQPAPAAYSAEPDFPATLPVPNRRISRNPRRLRRAA
jgi:hypothetical protein